MIIFPICGVKLLQKWKYSNRDRRAQSLEIRQEDHLKYYDLWKRYIDFVSVLTLLTLYRHSNFASFDLALQKLKNSKKKRQPVSIDKFQCLAHQGSVQKE